MSGRSVGGRVVLLGAVIEDQGEKHDDQPPDDPRERKGHPEDVGPDASDRGVHWPDKGKTRDGHDGYKCEGPSPTGRGVPEGREDETTGYVVRGVRHGEGATINRTTKTEGR